MASEQSFGDWLRQRRQELDLTREELARQVGCSTISLRKLEAEERRPSKQMAERLADVLQVAPANRPTFLRFARGDPFAAPALPLALEQPLQPQRLPHNLPLQLTSFVGREKEIAKVKRLLAKPAGTRLLTLTGVGGTGKTRLALQVAADLVDQIPDGVWLVELAALADPALLPRAVAAPFGLRDEAARTTFEILVDYLRPKAIVLILDNCEHLIDACAQLAEQLLRAAPKLCVLATSREPLGLVGESIFYLPSLSLPQAGRAAPEALAQSEAGRLFAERAAAVRSDFAVTAANASAVVQICRRLDGIPLALELAAARVRTMPAEQIAGRLDDRFRLLTGGGRTALERHQTLRATMDWSWDLLAEPERVLLRRLSAFVDGWTLEAAEAIGAGDGLETAEVLDLLTRLVDKSLVLAEDQSGEARYRLLETVRQYALGKLFESGETEPVRDRHLDFFVRLAEAAEPKLRSAEEVPWLNRLEAEHGNLRVALSWSLEGGAMGPEAGLCLAGALSQFWSVRPFLTEGLEWLTRILELPQASAPTLKRAKALNGAAFLAYSLDDLATARALYEEALPIWRAAGPRPGLADALRILGNVVVHQGDAAAGQALLDESLAMSRALGDDEGAAWTLLDQGQHAYYRGENDAARAMRQESLALHRNLGNPTGIGILLSELGRQALVEGDLESVQPMLEESVTFSRAVGDRPMVALALGNLGRLAAIRGDFTAAESLLEEGLSVWRELGLRPPVAYALLNLGLMHVARGDLASASELIREGISRAEESGNRRQLAFARYCTAQLLYYEGRLALAVPLLEECVVLSRQPRAVISRQPGDPWVLPDALSLLGWIAHSSGDKARASALLRESLGLYREVHRKRESVACVEWLVAVEGDGAHAARLLGAAEAMRAVLGAPVAPVDRDEYDQIVAGVRTQLDKAAFARAWAEGRALGEADWYKVVAEELAAQTGQPRLR